MNETPTEEPAVDQKDFAHFLQGLNLETMRVRELKVDAKQEFAHNQLKTVRHHEEYSYEYSEDGPLRIDASFQVQIIGPKKKKLGAISVMFSWYYTSEQPITDDIFKIFGPMVRFQTWPHLREVIQSTATRVNWPRLTIPLLVAQNPSKEASPP